MAKRRHHRGTKGPDRSRQLVSARTVAEEWGCSARTVHRIVESQRIPVYYLHDGKNGTKRFRREDIDKYVEACRSDN